MRYFDHLLKSLPFILNDKIDILPLEKGKKILKYKTQISFVFFRILHTMINLPPVQSNVALHRKKVDGDEESKYSKPGHQNAQI